MKKLKLIKLALIILGLNIIWEFAHAPLYISEMLINNYYFTLIPAACYDLLLISGIFLIISLFHKSVEWIKKPEKKDWLLIIILGFIVAAVIEKIALSVGKWSYKELMPTIFGIGFTPLIQLFTTAIISLWIINYKNY